MFKYHDVPGLGGFFFLTRWSLSVFKLYRKKKGVALAVQTQGMSP